MITSDTVYLRTSALRGWTCCLRVWLPLPQTRIAPSLRPSFTSSASGPLCLIVSLSSKSAEADIERINKQKKDSTVYISIMLNLRYTSINVSIPIFVLFKFPGSHQRCWLSFVCCLWSSTLSHCPPKVQRHIIALLIRILHNDINGISEIFHDMKAGCAAPCLPLSSFEKSELISCRTTWPIYTSHPMFTIKASHREDNQSNLRCIQYSLRRHIRNVLYMYTVYV